MPPRGFICPYTARRGPGGENMLYYHKRLYRATERRTAAEMEAMPLKALSIHPYYACMIFSGDKTVECRTWDTKYRGDLLICSTAKKLKYTIPGHALCVVRLVDVVPFTKGHLKLACMEPQDWTPGLFAWLLEDVRIIKPIPLKGRLGLWDYDGPIEYLEPPKTDEEDEEQYNMYWRDLFV